MTQQLDSSQLLSLLDSSKLLVVCGSGGVGKTTMSAALGALAATHLHKKVLVLTVDPARRLADALGLQAIGNAVVQVDAKAFNEAGVVPQGQLFAAMIDTKASWDDLIHRHAPTPAIAQRVLANALYTNLTERFVHSHDYIAMERLYDVYQSGAYDLVVVDTPPSRNALDVLDAPMRMRDFFDSRLLQLLTTPAQSRVISLMSKPFFQVADRILGARFLSSITEFLHCFAPWKKGSSSAQTKWRACFEIPIPSLQLSPPWKLHQHLRPNFYSQNCNRALFRWPRLLQTECCLLTLLIKQVQHWPTTAALLGPRRCRRPQPLRGFLRLAPNSASECWQRCGGPPRTLWPRLASNSLDSTNSLIPARRAGQMYLPRNT